MAIKTSRKKTAHANTYSWFCIDQMSLNSAAYRDFSLFRLQQLLSFSLCWVFLLALVFPVLWVYIFSFVDFKARMNDEGSDLVQLQTHGFLPSYTYIKARDIKLGEATVFLALEPCAVHKLPVP